MPTPHGIGFSWGVDPQSSAFGSSYDVQSYTLNNKGEKKLLKNSVGETAGYCGFDPIWEVNVDVVPTNASATLTASVALPTLYSMNTITSTSDPNVTGSNWICENVSLKGQMDDFKKYTVTLVKYPLVTT